jgi:ribosomal protein S8
MKRFNLESYKDLLIEMNEKTTFRFDELSQTRWDVFNVLKTNGYIRKVDKALYTWAAKKPTRATAKRVAMLTFEYRKSWASSQKDKKDVKDIQTKMNFKTPKPKQMDKRQNREQLAAIGTMILVTAIALTLVIAFISNF